MDCELASSEFKSLVMYLRRQNRCVIFSTNNSLAFLDQSGSLGFWVNIAKAMRIPVIAVLYLTQGSKIPYFGHFYEWMKGDL